MLVRKVLKPNPGENFEAQIAHKILAYLSRRAPDGRWVSRREMLRAIRAYDKGPAIADRALVFLEHSGEIIQVTRGTQKQGLVRLAGPETE